MRALLLLAPSPPTPEPIEEDARAELIAGWGKYGAVSKMLARITAAPLPDDARRLAIDDMLRCGKAAWTAWLTGGSRQDISAAMPRISVPVTILSGTCDAVLSTELMHDRVAGALADARVDTVPGAGHLLPLEAPRTVAAAILSVAARVSKHSIQPVGRAREGAFGTAVPCGAARRFPTWIAAEPYDPIGSAGEAGRATATDGGRISIAAGANNAAPAVPATVWLVRYDPRTRNVRIGRGENGDRILPRRNVVAGLRALGTWVGQAVSFAQPAYKDAGERSAVIIQRGRGGPVLAARKL